MCRRSGMSRPGLVIPTDYLMPEAGHWSKALVSISHGVVGEGRGARGQACLRLGHFDGICVGVCENSVNVSNYPFDRLECQIFQW